MAPPGDPPEGRVACPGEPRPPRSPGQVRFSRACNVQLCIIGVFRAGFYRRAFGGPRRRDAPARRLPLRPLRVQPRAGELVSGSDLVPIARKPAELLHVLLCHRDRVVSKREILETLWPGIRVSDAAFASALRDLRRALGDTGRHSRYIATLRARGLRFLAPVETQEIRRADAVPSTPGRVYVGRANCSSGCRRRSTRCCTATFASCC